MQIYSWPRRLAWIIASALRSFAKAVALSTQLSDKSWSARMGRCDIFHTTLCTPDFALSFERIFPIETMTDA